MHETASNISAPALVYLGMGLVMARILLDNTKTRHFTWLQWLQFLVDGARITLLWPLVLFIEKLQGWLNPSNGGESDDKSH